MEHDRDFRALRTALALTAVLSTLPVVVSCRGSEEQSSQTAVATETPGAEQETYLNGYNLPQYDSPIMDVITDGRFYGAKNQEGEKTSIVVKAEQGRVIVKLDLNYYPRLRADMVHNQQPLAYLYNYDNDVYRYLENENPELLEKAMLSFSNGDSVLAKNKDLFAPLFILSTSVQIGGGFVEYYFDNQEIPNNSYWRLILRRDNYKNEYISPKFILGSYNILVHFTQERHTYYTPKL